MTNLNINIDVNKFEYCLIFTFLLVSSLTRMVIPRRLGYILTLGMILLLTIYALTKKTTYAIPKYAFVSLGPIFLVYFYHLSKIQQLTIARAIRVPIFVFASVVAIFIIPSIIDPKQFISVISKLTAIVVVGTLPTAFLGTYSVLGFEIPSFNPNPEFQFWFIDLFRINFPFSNPNGLALFAMVGMLAALYEFDIYHSRTTLAILFINSIGILLTKGRSAIVAAIIGGLLYLAYSNYGRRGLYTVLIPGIVTGVISYFMLFFDFSLLGLGSINLSGRRTLWNASIQAVIENPIIGLGPGDTGKMINSFVKESISHPPANSYLRLFLTTGVIGGFSYLVFISTTLFYHILRVDGILSMAFLSIVIAFIIAQLFAAFSLFGISYTSLSAALIFGYSIRINQTDSGI